MNSSPKFLKKNYNKILDYIKLDPSQILVLGFLFVILSGTFLLNLPMSSREHNSVGLVNALFTSTSAVCVTGLAVVNTLEYWSLFGQIVILVLIQIGGLGFMTVTTALFLMLGKKITLKERILIQESLNQNTLEGMVRLIKNVIRGTFIIEGVGAALLCITFIPENGFIKGTWMSIFHSISAFCNAGFDITGNSIVPYQSDIIVNVTIMLLIILGGLGFTVWYDVLQATKFKYKLRLTNRKWFLRLKLHTKIVLVMTLGLIISGFILFALIEWNNPYTIGNLSFFDKLLASMFQSVTTRTAGFNSIDIGKMTDASKFLTIILMFIGGSPAATAGGVKTVTIGVIIFTVISVVKGKESTEIFNRRIPSEIVKRSLAVLSISLLVVISVTMALSITENKNFLDIFYEATSAFATVGLSVGITPSISNLGKLILCMTMFIGRLGPVTMAIAFSLRQNKKNTAIKYPEEKVLVG